MSYTKKVFFITGSSRSGTTMMMRILNRHHLVHTINEPQFFEKFWQPDGTNPLSETEASKLYRALVTRQREGFFATPTEDSYSESISSLPDETSTRSAVYDHFIFEETRLHQKLIPCEKTPQNVFFLNEIFELYPNARVIHMVRDPRSVLLSQKKKWKRKFLGSDEIPWKEVLRLRVNYHPITISKLWNSAENSSRSIMWDSRVIRIRYEDLIASPQNTMTDLCKQLEIEYTPDLLEIPHASSSTQEDSKEKGIRKLESKWKHDLRRSEIHLCQTICKKGLEKNGYEVVQISPNPLDLLILYVSFPFKILSAFLLNLNRMSSIGRSLKRRLKTA